MAEAQEPSILTLSAGRPAATLAFSAGRPAATLAFSAGRPAATLVFGPAAVLLPVPAEVLGR